MQEDENSEFDEDEFVDSLYLEEDFNENLDEDDWEEPSLKQPSKSVNKVLIYGVLGIFILGGIFFIYRSSVSKSSSSGQDNNVQITQDLNTQIDSNVDVKEDVLSVPAPVSSVEETAFASVPSDLPSLPNVEISYDEVFHDDMLPGLEDDSLTMAKDEDHVPAFELDVADSETEPVADSTLDLPIAEGSAQSSMSTTSMAEEQTELLMESVSDISLSPSPIMIEMQEDFDLTKKVFESRLDEHDDVMAQIMKSLKSIEAELAKQKISIAAIEKMAKDAYLSKSVSEPQASAVKKNVHSLQKKSIVRHGKSSNRKTSSQTLSKVWVLKSAQPGKAVVANVKTNYLRSIEVGGILPEIGKIVSISRETGRWVVQGSQGYISQ